MSSRPFQPNGSTLAAASVVIGAVLFMCLSAWIFSPSWMRAFRSDSSPVSWLSSALLLTLAVVSARLTAEKSLSPRLGTWLALALLGLAIDEQFMFHELWKYRCVEWITLCEMAWLRELPIILVGILGTITAVFLGRAFGSQTSRCLMWIGIGIGLFSILVDQTSMPSPVAELEEGFEVLAEAFFLAALLTVWPKKAGYVQSSSRY